MASGSTEYRQHYVSTVTTHHRSFDDVRDKDDAPSAAATFIPPPVSEWDKKLGTTFYGRPQMEFLLLYLFF